MTELFESTDTFEEEPITEPAIEQENQEDDNEFDSGVNQAFGVDPEVKPEPEPEPEVKLFAGMTEDELKGIVSKAKQVDELNERLKKTHDTAFGRIGILEETVKALRQTKSQQPQVSKESFKALAEYLGDDNDEMLEALVKDFSQLQLGGESADTVAMLESINEQVNVKVDELNKSFEKKLLTLQHPDWETIKETEEFAEWHKTLKPDDADTLFNIWDGTVLATAFTKFKQWKVKKEEFAAKRQKRLEDAVLPKGIQGTSKPNLDDDFNQGLKKVIGNR